MTTIVEFLQARIAEDEADARAVIVPGPWHHQDGHVWHVDGLTYYQVAEYVGEDGPHIARHDPTRALAECVAKRQIIAAWELTHHNINLAMLYIIASVYSDHPDFNPAWGSGRQDT